jgi:hypothetical protein
MTESARELDACGFIRVPTTEGQQPLWMTCEQCGKSDHFWLEEDGVRCRCGATWSHAVRPDGTEVPLSELAFVPFRDGPMDLADLEWDPMRVGLVVVLLLSVLTAAALAAAWGLGWVG